MSSRLRVVAGIAAFVAAAALDDAAALLQGPPGTVNLASVGHHAIVNSEDGASAELGEQTGNQDDMQIQAAPVVEVESGRVKGYHDKGFDVFKSIPFAEPPARFQPPVEKRPWSPDTLNAREFGPVCIGASTGAQESEDCLTLNIWRPQGKHTDLPVIVYIHSGLNQRGSSQDPLRQGDMIVQSEKYPAIYVTFNYRLGIFGWLESLPQARWTHNVGLRDQQAALAWVNRNIAFFGGHPSRVTLQAEGDQAATVMAHMVSPVSGPLFQRVALHSPTIDRWSRRVNVDRSMFIVNRLGCFKDTNVTWTEIRDCLIELPAENISQMDWSLSAVAEKPGSPEWFQNFGAMSLFSKGKTSAQMQTFEGWHASIDRELVPGEPKELISQGQWNKVPVLITMTKNESRGIFPSSGTLGAALKTATVNLLKEGDYETMRTKYNETLRASEIETTNETDLLHMMFTDKLWTCEARSLAEFITNGGGNAYVSVFWHSPKYDPEGVSKTDDCIQGAACGSSDMLYLLPQGGNVGIHGEGMEEEISFSRKYSDDFLSFVYGERGPWEEFTIPDRAMTVYDTTGPRVEPGFKSAQCDLLDTSFGTSMPLVLQKQGLGHWIVRNLAKPIEEHEEAVRQFVMKESEKAGTIELFRKVDDRHNKRSHRKTVSSV